MSEWQPIETAPKDGSIICALVKWKGDIAPITIYWHEDDSWCGVWGSFCEEELHDILGWSPLPEPPKKKHICRKGNQVCELTPEGKLHFWEEGYRPNYITPNLRSLAFVKFCPFCGKKEGE